MLPKSHFYQDAVSLAQDLIGCELVHMSSEGTAAGIIVETEAYRQDDQASHSFGGLTKRNEVMFGPGGHAYIYFTYGMHYCFNIVAGTKNFAEAVLIRALEPTTGIELMQRRRKIEALHNLCSGPAKLVQAMGIKPAQNGASLNSNQLHIKTRQSDASVLATRRIGITRAIDKPWRFIMAGSPFVTKHAHNRMLAL